MSGFWKIIIGILIALIIVTSVLNIPIWVPFLIVAIILGLYLFFGSSHRGSSGGSGSI